MHLCQLIFDIFPADIVPAVEMCISEMNEFELLDLRVSSDFAIPGFAPSAPAVTGLFPNSVMNSF